MTLRLTITQIGTPKEVIIYKNTAREKKAEKNYLKATEYGDNFLNFWLNDKTKNWKVGDTVEVEAVEKRDYTAQDGSLKTSYDIKLPKFMGADTKALEEKMLGEFAKQRIMLQAIYDLVKGPSKVQGTDIDYPEYEAPLI